MQVFSGIICSLKNSHGSQMRVVQKYFFLDSLDQQKNFEIKKFEINNNSSFFHLIGLETLN